jgi:hypothetical protein
MWQSINAQSVNDRQTLVINRMLNRFRGFPSTSKYAKLAGGSTDTALRGVREMLNGKSVACAEQQAWQVTCEMRDAIGLQRRGA